MILSVNHQYDLKVKGSRLPENNIISSWIEVGCHFYPGLRKQPPSRTTPPLVLPQNDVCGWTIAEIVYWICVTTQIWARSASDWLKKNSLTTRPIRSSILIWEVSRHHCGISSLVPQASFYGKTSNCVANRGFPHWEIFLMVTCA